MRALLPPPTLLLCGLDTLLSSLSSLSAGLHGRPFLLLKLHHLPTLPFRPRRRRHHPLRRDEPSPLPLRRSLRWYDLVGLGIGGIGGMVGAGVFVTTGRAARLYSGPSIAGLCALLSAFCYTEFAVDIPGRRLPPRHLRGIRGFLDGGESGDGLRALLRRRRPELHRLHEHGDRRLHCQVAHHHLLPPQRFQPNRHRRRPRHPPHHAHHLLQVSHHNNLL